MERKSFLASRKSIAVRLAGYINKVQSHKAQIKLQKLLFIIGPFGIFLHKQPFRHPIEPSSGARSKESAFY